MNYLSLSLAFLLLGNAFSFYPSFGKVKEGVKIEGVFVGGMEYSLAEEEVRKRLPSPFFEVILPNGREDFSDRLLERDDLKELLRKAKKGEELKVSRFLEWPEMESELLSLCKKFARPAKNARVSFSSEGFTYFPEENGLMCCYGRLLYDSSIALKAGGGSVVLYTEEFPPEEREETLRKKTSPLSSFSTSFDETNLPRARNISLAAERISGTILLPGEEFSFNRTVGERTKENGFEIANVIEDGEYVPGVGGGVCQASTTLYNAALLAGMKIVEARAHSLRVGYVPPSRDAMVSNGSDLRFKNPFPSPVYLLSRAGGGMITVSFFGLPDGKRYEIESVIIKTLPPPEPELVEGENIFREGKEGTISESYLCVYEGERLILKTRIRKDCYRAVRGKKSAASEDFQNNSQNAFKIPCVFRKNLL